MMIRKSIVRTPPKPKPLEIIVHLHGAAGDRVIPELLTQILTRISALEAQGVRIMAKFQEVSDELDAIKTAVDESIALGQAQIVEIAALKQQLLDGTAVTPEQLDSLDAKADSILAALKPGSPTA